MKPLNIGKIYESSSPIVGHYEDQQIAIRFQKNVSSISAFSF